MSKKTYTDETARAIFERRNAAQEALKQAIQELRNADMDWVRYELSVAPSAAERAMDFLTQNTSTWSGGYLSTNNITEASVREAAAGFSRFGFREFN